jgi:DNA-binding GntR family transcriptional regulator
LDTSQDEGTDGDDVAQAHPSGFGGSVAAAVFEQLRSEIVTGQLAPGALLEEPETATRLGVSRTPVRAALLHLQAEGLATRHHRQTFVAELTPSRAAELYSVRIALELLALEEAMRADRAALLGELKKIMLVMRHAAEHETDREVADAGRSFHRAIYHASGNEVLLGILDQLQNRIDQYRYFSTAAHAPRGLTAVDEHSDLMQALETGDLDTARRKLRTHLETGRENVLSRIAEHETSERSAS